MQVSPTCKCDNYDHQKIQAEVASLSTSETNAIIDGRLAELDSIALSLKTLRNRRARISSLPTEILSIILTEAVRPLQNFLPCSWRSHVQLTAVCTLWREVALECPSFWSCIPITQNLHLAAMLSRSKQHPLSIRADISNITLHTRDCVNPAVLHVLYQPFRLSELHLKGETSYLEKYLAQFPMDAPVLRSLIITREIGTYSKPRLPAHILLSPKLSLRYLELTRCNVEWGTMSQPTLPIKNLITLVLKDLERPPPYPLLLNLLVFSPRLEELELHSVVTPDLPVLSSEHQDIIGLTQLKEYRVSDSLSRILALWSHLYIPRKAVLNIEATSTPADQKKLSAQIETLLRVCTILKKHRPRRSFQSLHLAATSSYTDLRLFDGPWVAGFHPGRTPAQIVVRGSSGSFVLKQLSVADLRNINISIPHNPRSSWRSFFRRHPQIRGIHISGSEIHGIIDSLGSVDKQAGKTETTDPNQGQTSPVAYATSLPLERLKEIIINGAQFMEDRSKCRNYRSLQDLLIDRCNYGVPIPRFDFEECSGITYPMVEELENIAGEDCIDWDGIDIDDELDFDEDEDDSDVDYNYMYGYGPY
jgi:hypothetical protein